jgi:hypothetical protein
VDDVNEQASSNKNILRTHYLALFVQQAASSRIRAIKQNRGKALDSRILSRRHCLGLR